MALLWGFTLPRGVKDPGTSWGIHDQLLCAEDMQEMFIPQSSASKCHVKREIYVYIYIHMYLYIIIAAGP